MNAKTKLLLRIVLLVTPILLLIILTSTLFVLTGENNFMGAFQAILAYAMGWILGHYLREKNKTKDKDPAGTQPPDA